MIENGFFLLGGPETQLHDILWAVHDGKNHGRSEGEVNIMEFPVTVGGRGREMHGGWALSEPERDVHLLNSSEAFAY